ncbi:hypothetical protein scyTo_0015592 [Scyliorhinus torazame]|uniref:Uncharacterized protein n=1 Tax=Scyliorhinus torazame TaxID=75743 RepID=A0A401PVA7_SCYTO|nr:hypothetical protein [Scyliorhinus torazame]
MMCWNGGRSTCCRLVQAFMFTIEATKERAHFRTRPSHRPDLIDLPCAETVLAGILLWAAATKPAPFVLSGVFSH